MTNGIRGGHGRGSNPSDLGRRTPSERQSLSCAGRPGFARLHTGAVAGAGMRRASRITQHAEPRWTYPSGTITRRTLAVRRLGFTGPPVVLMHGMAGSQIYWGGDFDVLAEHAKLIAVDLLGFGQSPKPTTGYGPRAHAGAVAACLHELEITEPAILVGHSMGTLVALALAKYHPELVDKVVAIAPPIYSSRAQGMHHIRGMGTLEGLMAFGPMSRLMCRWMCNHRALATRLAPHIEPSLPRAIARAGVQHTWASYSQSMDELILACDAQNWLATTTRPVHIVVALDDPVPDLSLLSRLRGVNRLISLDTWPEGGHHLPLTNPIRCVAPMKDAILNRGSPS